MHAVHRWYSLAECIHVEWNKNIVFKWTLLHTGQWVVFQLCV